MPAADPDPPPSRFPETRWSMVLNADDGAGRSALNELCQLYWRPLYAYCCSMGRRSADAEDLTQGYFAQLLNRGALRMADPQRGKFRTFLLSSFKNYLADVHRHGAALKRGGGAVHLSLNMEGAEALEPPTEIEPELAFDRQWAQDLVSRATRQLRCEYAEAGKAQWFDQVAGEQAGASYLELAQGFGSTEEAVKSFAQRVRKRFRALLEREIADTVATPGEVAAEMAYLAELLRV